MSAMRSNWSVLAGVLLAGVGVVGANEGTATILEPAYLIADVRLRTLRDLRLPGSSGHALLTEAPDDLLPLPLLGTTPALLFETRLYPSKAKARSEVRVRGADVHFADVDSDPYYYTQFDIFLPDEPESDLFERERTYRGDWNIVWQCAQLGAAPPHYYRVSSPPLSLQLYGRRLFVRTFSDYAQWSTDLPNEDVYDRWHRSRSDAGQLPEVGETTQDGARPAAILRRPLVYAGYLRRGEWNRVFMQFKLGEHGSYRLWLNGQLEAQFAGPIGLRTADDFLDPTPKIDLPGVGPRIKKRASVRFGIYQGYGDPQEATNVATHTRVLFRRFAIGTDSHTVRFGGR